MDPAIRQADRRLYRREIAPWLPPRIIDCHVHVGLPEHVGPISPERLKSNWAYEVGVSQSWEDLRGSLDMLFPDREVSVLAFGTPLRETDLEANNAYALQGSKQPANNACALMVTRPEWDADVIAAGLDRGFAGIKPYPDLAPETENEPTIFDFLPHSHMRVLNERSAMVTLHLPRAGRLSDERNIADLLEISERYASVRVVLAHIGRAFCLPFAEKGLPHFADRPAICFDISANLNPDVIRLALEIVGPDRLLYGSDLPITLIRGVREHVGENYVNYTDGDFSWNTNRKSPEEESRYTFYLYEELKALISAVRSTGMGAEAMEKILYSNASRMLACHRGPSP